jgi:arsenite/tail-anchored protein-transporting ATPase
VIDRLDEDDVKLMLFGGKGGVGKTTIAASVAIHLAGKFKTLLLSTDPAHSLSDSLEQPVGDEIVTVKGVDRLYALEISAEKSFSDFKEKYGFEIKRILDTSTSLDQDDIDAFFSLSIPGIDEVMGLKTIITLIEEGKYEKFVVDTAPTGHALRLLALPRLFNEWIRIAAKMRWKYRYIVERFSGRYDPDQGDTFLVDMKKMVNGLESLFTDGRRCMFVAITIPEGMAVFETERLIKNLHTYGIEVNQLIVNNVVGRGNCEFSKERKKEHERYLEILNEKFNSLDITVVPLQPREVKGLDALNNFKEMLFQ